MLTRLDIRGLAIIDALSVDFAAGFNVITGETGAGKSILIRALSLLLGSKASPETVRRGRDSAVVSGHFEVPAGHPCLDLLSRHGIGADAEAAGGPYAILVRRSIQQKGRSLAWINDIPVTVGVLRDLAAPLIDVFGQHDNLRLLDPAQHTNYVDLFLERWELRGRYREVFADVEVQRAELMALLSDLAVRRRDADYHAYRFDELERLAPSAEDFIQVVSLCQRAGEQVAVMRALEGAGALLDADSRGGGVPGALREMTRILERAAASATESSALAELGAMAAAAAATVDDLSFRLAQVASSLETDPGELEAATARLARYQEFFRRFEVADAPALVAARQHLAEQIERLATAAAEVEARLAVLAERARELRYLAGELTQARSAARQVARQRIEAELAELAMAGARIDIEFSPSQRHEVRVDWSPYGERAVALGSEVADALANLTDQGAERAQFLLAANAGEDLLPLHRIASGGEASRLMLALKKSLAAGGDTCILVFDEIDTGISGRVADVVGHKMQELGERFQVICISHLAQVAAHANAHFRVEKRDQGQRTEVVLTRLSAAGCVEEVARLLSGTEVTPQGLANARALIERARHRDLGATAPPRRRIRSSKGHRPEVSL